MVQLEVSLEVTVVSRGEWAADRQSGLRECGRQFKSGARASELFGFYVKSGRYQLLKYAVGGSVPFQGVRSGS